jgi:diadenylate cyclase
MSWLHWQSCVDFLVLAAVFYVVLLWAKETRAMRIVIGIVSVHAVSRLAERFDLTITSWVLNGLSILLILALLFAFQSEIRHALMRLDGMLRLGLYPLKALQTSYSEVGGAAFAMAAQRVGALIVITRRDSIRELVSGGITLGAEISPPLLAAIFDKTSPLHDGAVTIDAGRVTRAGAVLPLTQRSDVPPHFGTRHRAAMGLAERCDALVIVVSEERGDVTLMEGRRIIRVAGVEDLLRLLESLQARRAVHLTARVRGWLSSNLKLKLAAAGLASLIWSVTLVSIGTAVRTVAVPLEFYNVPPGLTISNQSVTRVELQLRGSPWIMNAVALTGLVARLDLKRVQPGWLSLPIGVEAVDLPPGVAIGHVSPQTVAVHIVRLEKQ